MDLGIADGLNSKRRRDILSVINEPTYYFITCYFFLCQRFEGNERKGKRKRRGRTKEEE